jgi:predicted transcriptional regulator
MVYYAKIYTDESLPNRAKLVYFYLRDRMDKEGIAWPGINRIAADLSLSRSTVKRALHDLVNAGYIKKEAAYRDNGSATSNRYHILRYAELGSNE